MKSSAKVLFSGLLAIYAGYLFISEYNDSVISEKKIEILIVDKITKLKKY